MQMNASYMLIYSVGLEYGTNQISLCVTAMTNNAFDVIFFATILLPISLENGTLCIFLLILIETVNANSYLSTLVQTNF